MKKLIIKFNFSAALLLLLCFLSTSAFKTTTVDLFTLEDISPKLTERYFTMTLNSTVESEMSFRIMTLMGEIQLKDTKEIKVGRNAVSFDLGDLDLGAYQIAIKIKNQINVLQVKRVSPEEIQTINFAKKNKDDKGN
ncbi:MAG: hypothetical protein AB8G15_02695 [Saprospiraceae bacterium]